MLLNCIIPRQRKSNQPTMFIGSRIIQSLAGLVTYLVVVCSSFTITSRFTALLVVPVHYNSLFDKKNTAADVFLGKESSGFYASKRDTVDDEALERTRKQLDILKGTTTGSSYVADINKNSVNNDSHIEAKEELYQQLIKKPANDLKEQLKYLKLPLGGRKPDLARRLVDHFLAGKKDENNIDEEDNIELETQSQREKNDSSNTLPSIKKFASINLSSCAGMTLARAGFTKPTDIQSTALPLLTKQRESLIIHAETGSGKTLTYLLPMTENLWNNKHTNPSTTSYALILTPTRELAAQVAGVATSLSPPNSVRLVTTPTNLLRPSYEQRERSELEFGGRFDTLGSSQHVGKKIIVGSAKSIFTSLFGDSKMPVPPTSKPEAKIFLQSVEV